MDANELKAFESLTALTEAQAKIIDSLQSLEKLQPILKPERDNNECEKGYPTLIDPNILWTAHGFPIHEGMSLVTILARADGVEINEEYLRRLEQEQNIRHARFVDARTNIHTIVVHQPWETEIDYTSMISVSLKRTEFHGRYWCRKWRYGRACCESKRIDITCQSDRSCAAHLQQLCPLGSWCNGFRLSCVRCSS